MFKKAGIQAVYNKHKETLRQLGHVEDHLGKRFAGMKEQIRAIVLAAASGEPLLLVGPPGTAKSRLVRAFCQTLGLLPDADMHEAGALPGDVQKVESHEAYFEYLLTPFTEPSELFGYFDIAALQSGEGLRRIETNMMQHAQVVFLDEIFNASSAILNSLLTFINERKFHDRGTTWRVPLKMLFAASNHTPAAPELLAVFDRFLLRSWVYNAPHKTVDVRDLLDVGWRETHAPPGTEGELAKDVDKLLGKLEAFRGSLEKAVITEDLIVDKASDSFHRVAGLVEQMRRSGLSDVSNRRLVKFSKVMLVHAMYRRANSKDHKVLPEIEAEDRLTLLRYGADQDAGEQVRRIESTEMQNY